MKLVIGGYAQGKLQYVLQKYQLEENAVWDAALPDEKKMLSDITVVNHLHQWVRSRLLDGGCPEEEVQSFVDRCGDCIIICDEIGNGIVPMEAFERKYRERTGRMLIQLAQRAEEVERVICGIGQKIK